MEPLEPLEPSEPPETLGALETLLRTWSGEEVVLRYDRVTGAWIVIAVHSTHLGPAGGGTRMKSYARLEAAVQDAQRLAEGMTHKFALAGLPRGGGKAVIAVPPDLETAARADLLRRYGALVKQLGGLFSTGPDVGTSALDMDTIAETGAPYVFGRTPTQGGAGDSGPATAVGVLAGMRVTCAQLFGSSALTGRRIVVQGAGNVGGPLLRLLRDAGADVAFSDIDPQACHRMQSELGVAALAPELTYRAECDIFAPCALGAVLSAATIPQLGCRAVVGSANNQLATPEDGERLRERHIVYAPDVVVNCGGAMYLLGRESLGWSEEETLDRIAATVHNTLAEVYTLADRQGITTTAATGRLVEGRLAGPRHGS